MAHGLLSRLKGQFPYISMMGSIRCRSTSCWARATSM